MKYKVEHCIEVMHYKSTELVQFVQRDLREHCFTFEDRIISDLMHLKEMASTSEMYYEDPDFKVSFDSIAATLNYVFNTLSNLVGSRIIPQLRSNFAILVNEYGKKITEEQLESTLDKVVGDFADSIKDKVVSFISQIEHTREQATRRHANFEKDLEIYNRLNKEILEGQFIEEVSLLHALSSLLQELVVSLDILTKGIESLQDNLATYSATFSENFTGSIEKNTTRFIRRLTGKKEEIETIPSQSTKRKTKISDIKNIDSMPMPDFTTGKRKNSIQIAIDFPYKNNKIIDVVMQFNVGKYSSRSLKLEMETILQKKAIFILSGPSGVDLEEHRKDVVHDIIATIQLVVKRRRIEVEVQPELNENYITKIIPKVPFNDGNLSLIRYEKNGKLVIEYVDLAEETEKVERENLQKVLQECFCVF